MNIQENLVITRINKNLHDLGINFKDFNGFLKKYNIVLSGSFLLKAITNNTYEFYDIDLYILGNRNEILEDEITKSFINLSISNICLTFLPSVFLSSWLSWNSLMAITRSIIPEPASSSMNSSGITHSLPKSLALLVSVSLV